MHDDGVEGKAVGWRAAGISRPPASHQFANIGHTQVTVASRLIC